MELVTTKIVWDIDGRVIEHEGYWYGGLWDKLCGANKQQKDIEASQARYYDTLTQQAQEIFGKAKSIFTDLQATFLPILKLGPNQPGFAPEERQAYENQITNDTGRAYHKAANALNSQLASQGGGDVPIVSGANNQLRANLVSSAAQQEGTQRAQLDEEDYAIGRENFREAAGVLSGATSMFNPASTAANSATEGGNAASKTANDIAEADNSWASAVVGAIGGVAGSVATGGMSNLGKGKGFFG